MPDNLLHTQADQATPLSLQEVKARIDAAVLRHVSLSMGLTALAGILIFLGLAMLDEQTPAQRRSRIISAAVLCLASVLAIAISKRWDKRVATGFFATVCFVVAYGSAMAVGSGIASSGATMPAAWIVVMGFVIGPRAGVIATRTAVVGVLAMLGAQWAGLITGIHAGNAQPAASYGVVLIMIFLLIGSTITQYSELFWNAMGAIDTARKALQAKVEAQEKTQMELLESKQRLTALLDHAPMSVLIFDKDSGRLHYANQNALTAHGASRLQELQRQCVYPHAPYLATDLVQRIHATRDHGTQRFQWRSRAIDGRDIWWEVQFDMLTLDDVPYVVSFGHDITTRLQAEQALIDHRAHLEEQVRERAAEALRQKHRLEAVIEALPVSLTIKDKAGRYQLSNRLFEEAAGLYKTLLLGRTPQELFTPEQAARFTEHDQALLQGAPMVRFESTHTRRDGSCKDHLVTKVPLLDAHGTPEAILTLTVDISEQKSMQRELAAAKNEAEHLASVKSAFLANMSHEIRTPLHGMLGMAQIGQHLPDAPQQATQAFARIAKSGKHLLGVINDILDFSKIDAGKLTVDHCPLDPRQVAEDAVSMVEGRARDKGLKLTLQCEPTPHLVMGDPLRTRQILINLLSNAVKFTEQGSVTLHLRAHEGQLHYAICDTGIGMHPEAQARVFSPFEQADGSTSRRFGGTGLGLSISQQLARLMGGDITLRSALAEGSTFTLSLPLQEASALATLPALHRPTQAQQTGPRLRGLHILAADDVDINRDILMGLLSQHEATVDCCGDGKQALQLLRERGPGHFDIVLMDVQMPVMNGLQATQLLHMIEPGLPVVALTAHAMPQECARCTEAGMVGHLAKPFETEELLAVILQHARRAPLSTPEKAAEQTSGQASPTLAPPGAPLLDMAGALRRCGGQYQLLRKLLARFSQEQADFVARCHAMIQDDVDGARRAVHALKGTAANLGMAGLSHAAGQLEDALHAREMALAPALMDTLAGSLRSHLAEVGHWLEEAQPA